MFFFWYLINFFLIIHSCISDQLCINKCQIEHDMQKSFVLPPECSVIRQEECSVILIFNYASQTVTIDFSFESQKQQLPADYKTNNVVHTVINLEDQAFVEHTVEYYCSTGDNCDVNYVKDIAIPSYSIKTCRSFRQELVRYLNPDPSLSQRECSVTVNTTMMCQFPCQLDYQNREQISRSCDGSIDLGFETSVGQSTPINKPEYNTRTFSYACNPDLCNSLDMQYRIQRLISLDDGECMIILNKTAEPTTPIATTTPIITTTRHQNHGTTFSISFPLIIFIFFFMTFFK